MAAVVTRTMASVGSSMRGSGTSTTVRVRTSSYTTAFTGCLPFGLGALLVDELGGNARREVHQLVGGLHVADDGGQVAFQLELALHHALDGVQLLSDDLLPPRVGGPDDELRLLALIGRYAELGP